MSGKYQHGQKSKKVCLGCEKRRAILIECRECVEMGCGHLMSGIVRPDTFSIHVAGSSKGSTGLCNSRKCRDAMERKFREGTMSDPIPCDACGGSGLAFDPDDDPVADPISNPCPSCSGRGTRG